MSTAKGHLTQYREKKEEAISEQFKKKIRARLDSTATSIVSDLYSRFADCLQDVALTNWNDVASKVKETDRSTALFLVGVE